MGDSKILRKVDKISSKPGKEQAEGKQKMGDYWNAKKALGVAGAGVLLAVGALARGADAAPVPTSDLSTGNGHNLNSDLSRKIFAPTSVSEGLKSTPDGEFLDRVRRDLASHKEAYQLTTDNLPHQPDQPEQNNRKSITDDFRVTSNNDKFVDMALGNEKFVDMALGNEKFVKSVLGNEKFVKSMLDKKTKRSPEELEPRKGGSKSSKSSKSGKSGGGTYSGGSGRRTFYYYYDCDDDGNRCRRRLDLKAPGSVATEVIIGSLIIVGALGVCWRETRKEEGLFGQWEHQIEQRRQDEQQVYNEQGNEVIGLENINENRTNRVTEVRNDQNTILTSDNLDEYLPPYDGLTLPKYLENVSEGNEEIVSQNEER